MSKFEVKYEMNRTGTRRIAYARQIGGEWIQVKATMAAKLVRNGAKEL